MIPYGRQDISEADIEAVVAVLRSDFITQGPAIERFERAVADYCGVPHAVAVSNATAALHIACLAVGLGPGDRLWTVPNTFVASANCALYCGATVDFVDIDPKTYTMDVARLAEKLAAAAATNTLPRVVVPVAFAGQSCRMREIRALADRYGFVVLEDAAHAIGGRYEGRPVGDGRYADMTVFSFHPVKIITTGEGGMVLTRNDTLAEQLRLLRSHGITRNPAQMMSEYSGHAIGGWEYQQVALGFNYRMTDIQAALGASQMTRLDDFVARRRALAARYDQLLADLPVKTPWQHPDNDSAYHLYPVRIQAGEGLPDRRTVFDRLRAAGIGVNVHYIPVHTQPVYQAVGFQPGDFSEAEAYYASAISLPLFAAMTEAEQDTVVAALASALSVPATV
ncbi:MAG: UDP-4-amino-4,6-dideoxy-N-acetyl-beta-L-altrosamine transaminase [Candidatus Melainabacteria bacterium]